MLMLAALGERRKREAATSQPESAGETMAQLSELGISPKKVTTSAD